MLLIEFLKILKRKFNYFYFIFLSVFVILFIYNEKNISSFLNIDNNGFLYDYLFKIVLLMFSFIIIVNTVINYRDDYSQKVIKLINNSNIGVINNLISKSFSIIIIFFLQYIVLISSVFLYYIYLNKIQKMELLNYSSLKYFTLSLLFLYLINILSLFIVSLFNNTNLSISMIFLILLGSNYLVEFMKSLSYIFNFIQYTFLEIIPSLFDYITLDISSYKYNFYLIFIIINSLILNILLIVINKIKININN